MTIRNSLSLLYKRYKYYRFVRKAKFKIASTHETIDYIVAHRCSVSRYGDGEFDVAFGVSKFFQVADQELTSRLRTIINVDEPGFIVCLPLPLLNQANLRKEAQIHWKGFVRYNDNKLLELIKQQKYFDTQFTRFYMDYADKTDTKELIDAIQKIWENRNVYIIEGEATRFGEGNDFLKNTRSVHRILCPSKNAYHKYDEILSIAENVIPQDENALVLIALGMTATVLAYDLHQLGYQAIDIGHADIEYCWWMMKAKERCPVSGKATYEAGAYENIGDVDDENYKKQIVAQVR